MLSTSQKKIEPRLPTAQDNLGLARLAARRFAQGVPVEDTEQYADACVGLVLAEKDFNPEKGLFCSWAFNRARKEIINQYRQRRHSIPTVRLGNVDIELVTEEPVDYPLLETLLAPHEDDTDLDRRNRQLLIDYYLGGESQTAIARRLDLSKMTVCLAIKSAIAKIKARYTENQDD